MVSQMKKSELIEELRKQGETPPEKWGVVELRSRVLQIYEERGIPTKKNQRTDMREMVVQLNKASSRKNTLQQHCRDLGIPVTGNETKPQLQKAAMIRIYEKSTPDPMDPVGFGKAAALTYAEIRSDTQYCNWERKMFDSKDAEILPVKTQGYHHDEPTPMVTPAPTRVRVKQESAASSAGSANSSTAVMEMMGILTETVKELKEEVAELSSQKRAHKTPGSDDSFTKI
ncbi:Copia protein [Durusdinium trenchii]|uniref:Copia protein n=1 Tax=Durusdinium trenchii TaxID=1381693 RepID=A0ABP0KK88_9DINO